MVPLLWAGCGGEPAGGPAEITFPISALGAESEVVRRQLSRFMQQNPDIRVLQRETPDAADQRHQLFVQWLNAGADDPDILSLDVIWTPEFAAAGWILPLERFAPDTAAFFPSTITANRWRDSLYAMPLFVDVGMLYWRTDLMPAPPETFQQLRSAAQRARQERGLRYGLVWQGARYEGLVATFVEYLGAHGGRILDRGRVVVASARGIRALTEMRDQIYLSRIVPTAVLTWQEEHTRFAFQNGEAAFMRNWPYPVGLLQDSAQSRVAGKFAVAAMPAAENGVSTATLGGTQLAINRNTEHPEAAWKVVEYLTRPEQMRERAAVVGQFPTRTALYEGTALKGALAIPAADVRRIIERAVPRPVTPVYTQISELLQIHLHRALTRQREPEVALREAQAEMQRVLDRAGLGTAETHARR